MDEESMNERLEILLDAAQRGLDDIGSELSSLGFPTIGTAVDAVDAYLRAVNTGPEPPRLALASALLDRLDLFGSATCDAACTLLGTMPTWSVAPGRRFVLCATFQASMGARL